MVVYGEQTVMVRQVSRCDRGKWRWYRSLVS